MVTMTSRPQKAPPAASSSAREVYDSLPDVPGWKVEVIEGKIVMSPAENPDHSWLGTLLVDLCRPVAEKCGWRRYRNVEAVVRGSRDPFSPDFAMGPKDAPRWGKHSLFADGLQFAAEIVSEGSTDEDRVRKPRVYAAAGVPLYLVIDTIADTPTVTLFSDIKDDRYRTTTTVELGEKLAIPAPVDFILDTALLVD